MALSASSAFTGSVSWVRSRRRDSRPTWVSTGRPGRSIATLRSTLAVLRPTPGQRDEVLHAARHLAAEALDDTGGHADEALRLVLVEAGRADDVLDLERVGDGEVLGRRVAGEQVRASPCSPARRCTGPTGSWRRAARRGCGGRARRARAPCPGTRGRAARGSGGPGPPGCAGVAPVAAGATSAIGGRGYPPVPWLRCATSRSLATPGRRTSTASPRAGRSTSTAPTDAATPSTLLRAALDAVAEQGGGLAAAVGARRRRRRARPPPSARLRARSGRSTSCAGRCRSTSRGRSTSARSWSARTRRRGSRSTTAPSTGTPSRAGGRSRTSQERMAEPWFDPAGLPAPRGGRAARRLLLDQGAPRRATRRSARST